MPCSVYPHVLVLRVARTPSLPVYVAHPRPVDYIFACIGCFYIINIRRQIPSKSAPHVLLLRVLQIPSSSCGFSLRKSRAGVPFPPLAIGCWLITLAHDHGGTASVLPHGGAEFGPHAHARAPHMHARRTCTQHTTHTHAHAHTHKHTHTHTHTQHTTHTHTHAHPFTHTHMRTRRLKHKCAVAALQYVGSVHCPSAVERDT
jgi:hypothetical protein